MPKSESLARIERRVEVTNLYRRGLTMREIAETLGISVSTVCADVKAARSRWKEQYAADYDALKSEQLAKLDEVERAAWEGWDRSLRNAVKETIKDTPDGIMESVTTEGQAGDPRFLKVIESVIAKRCRILGLDAPHKIEIESTVTKTIEVVIENHSEAMSFQDWQRGGSGSN